jgi:transcriptional regulator with XRE-family HTH domain
VDHFSTEQFRTANGIVARQVAGESQIDNRAATRAFSFRSVTGARENAKGANQARNIALVGNLAMRRHTLGWSLKELADRCGIDENFLGDWERGTGSPRLDAAEHWAAALGLELVIVPAEDKARRGVQVDWDKRCITVDGAPIRLTPMEWKALERLARTPGELVTHQALFRHLYGDDRQHRAQSTAVRVLITKLRRLLPVRVEARWGQGYVISGLEPSLPRAPRNNDGARDDGAAPLPEVAEQPCERAASTPKPAPPTPPPIRRELADISASVVRRVAAAPTHPSPCRAEELGVIERFLAERGVTRCPDLTTIQQSPLPTLVWDKVKRKWVRPSSTGCAAVQAAGSRSSSTA